MEPLRALVAALLLLLISFHNTFASAGDRSVFYQKCVSNCVDKNCTSDGRTFKPALLPSVSTINQLMMWNCDEDCRYTCMWRTVAAFQEREYPIPKFHGKWPFLRVLGIQELGSVIGSVLNLVGHVLMYNTLRNAFSGSETPLLWLWRIFSLVCIHGWIWSIIFHCRDTPLTEFMDYACALSMVMILYVACVVRLSYGRSKLIGILVTVTSIMYYVGHVRYLYSGSINYEYNMMANIVPGAMAVIMWTIWGTWRYRRYRYTWRILLFNLLATLFLALEVLDFPPYMHLWDAHALWHLSTAILPFIFYRFVFDDLVFLQRSYYKTLEMSSAKIY